MAFLPSLDPGELNQYHRVLAHSVTLRSHLQVLDWLQGDLQNYLPHDILIAAWGNFATGDIQHDILSVIDGVRSQHSNPLTLTPMLMRFFTHWSEIGRKPFVLTAGACGFMLEDTGTKCALGEALQQMRSAMVHGIRDTRGSHDCVYVAFNADDFYRVTDCEAMGLVLPYIDSALRQVDHLPHQARTQQVLGLNHDFDNPLEQTLTSREFEILEWISMGKTNPEIGSILEISLFTVKNHVQRIFRKLNVSNRAQAVAKLTNDV